MANTTHILDQKQYQNFRDLIAEHTGLYFPDKKRVDLERGVQAALEKSAHDSPEDYFKALIRDPKNGDMSRLTNLLTVGETYFHRDRDQFKLLKCEILPKLINQRSTTTRRLRIWSAGCATGEEPYSLAIMLRELIPYFDTWDVKLIATDINEDALEKARCGRYGKWSFRSMPPEWLEKYFFRAPDDNYHISDIIKQSITFKRLNLRSDDYPSEAQNTNNLDLIVCRNVAIYFDQNTTDHMMKHFYKSLADRGWLLMGASDPIPPRQKYTARHSRGTFIYQKLSPCSTNRQEGTELTLVKANKPKNKLKPKPKPPIKSPQKTDSIIESKVLISVGQHTLALPELITELEHNPKSIELLTLVTEAHVARGNLDLALTYAQELTSIDKLSTRGYFLQSAIYQGLGQENKAIECLKKTVFLDKHYVIGHFSLGCLYKKQNRKDLARKSFTNVIKLMVALQKDEIVPECNGITFGKLMEIAELNLREKEQ